MKKALWVIVIICLVSVSIYFANYIRAEKPLLSVEKPLLEVLDPDPRNSGIDMVSNYNGYIQPSNLSIDVKSVSGDKSAADVFRVLLQYASKIKEKSFDSVLLQSKGITKFTLKGDYFQKLGKEYGHQNPVYTMRTFTEHLFSPDGSRAFSTWTGGLLGVMKKQMEDFTEFHNKWYIEDM